MAHPRASVAPGSPEDPNELVLVCSSCGDEFLWSYSPEDDLCEKCAEDLPEAPDVPVARPALRVVGDLERADVADGTQSRTYQAVTRGPAAPTRPAPAPERVGTVDWIAVALVVMVGAAGLCGLLYAVAGPVVSFLVYAAAVGMPVCRYAVTSRDRS